MNTITGNLVQEIRSLLLTLDRDGGLITPSIYETAQVLRFYPTTDRIKETVEWLLQQQRSDGAWGDPSAPLYRAVPTVAALLALSRRSSRTQREQDAVSAGIEAFESLKEQWQGVVPDDIPIAAELVLPRLLEDSEQLGLPISTSGFEKLRRLGDRRRHMIAHMRPTAGAPPLHAWETWGHQPEPDLADGSGGVGHSPAATAWWLHLARRRRYLKFIRNGAIAYLAAASRETYNGSRGIAPSTWPLQRFEMVFVLHSLLLAGLLHDPRLDDVVAPLIKRLAGMMGKHGVGYSDFFMPDGDDTAAAVAILAEMGHTGYVTTLAPFQADDHFRAFPFELHHAPTVTARGAHALALCGYENRPWMLALAASQLPDGRWVGDKWNRSWLYTTSVVLHTFVEAEDKRPLRQALGALLAHQHADGGWGSTDSSSMQETAYTVLALNTLRASGEWNQAAETSWRRAKDFLLLHFEHRNVAPERLWIDKELYTPIRVDRAFLLSALLVILQPEAAQSPTGVAKPVQVQYV